MKHIIMITFLFISTHSIFAQNAWINEFHYDNEGSDMNEFLEIVIENPGDYNLSDFTITLYNGNAGTSYDSKTLDQFTEGNSDGAFTFYYYDFPSNGIQNGSPDGFALDYQGAVIAGQFLSYEGVVTATDGPANGQSSTDIGVAESGGVTSDQSLQLAGIGDNYSSFHWQEAMANTKGQINTNQTFSSEVFPEPANHVTEFQVDSVKSNTIYLSWTGAVGDPLPQSYLLVGRTESGTYPDVVDATPLQNDHDWSDGQAAYNTAHRDGKNTLTVEELESEITYYFKIYPYTNSGSDIDYKTDGAVPEVSTTTTAVPVLSIADIQISDERDISVKTSGIVTAVSGSNFFIQDASAPWSGINIHAPDHSVSRGDEVRVSGTVQEYFDLTEITDLSELTVLSTGNDLPEPLTVSTGQANDEQYESVLLSIEQAECVDENPDAPDDFGEWLVDDGSGSLRVDDLMHPFEPVLGESYNITGVLNFSFGNFKLEPRDEDDISVFTEGPIITQMGMSDLPYADEDFQDTVSVVPQTGNISEVEFRYILNGADTVKVPMQTIAGSDSLYHVTIPSDTYNDGDRMIFWVHASDDAGNVSTGNIFRAFIGVTPIDDVDDVDENGELLYRGYYARVNGVATVGTGVLDSLDLDVYIQDETAGINIFQFEMASVNIMAGRRYEIWGELTQFNGKAEIVPQEPGWISDKGEAALPEAVEVTMSTLLFSPEVFEGLLVKITNVDTVNGTDPWPEENNWANLTVSDDGGASQMTLRIESATNIDGAPEPAWPQQSITGIFSQYDTEAPFSDGYQLIPRSADDFSDLTGIVADNISALPNKLTLYDAYPNPFNPATTIAFDLPARFINNHAVELHIFNALGKRVRTFDLRGMQAGRNTVRWQGRSDQGNRVSSGIYFAVLRSGRTQHSTKLLLIK